MKIREASLGCSVARKTSSLSYSRRALRYARNVVAGEILSCELLRLACERHLKDLERAKDRKYPYSFSDEKGDRICHFAERMVHVKGKWAKPDPDDPTSVFIVLEDWQCFLLAVGFGWIHRKTGLRRFREFYWEIPRKNTKSTLGAIIANYMVSADGEQGADVFAGATTQKQAMKVFEPAWLMIQNNPAFQSELGLNLGGTPENPGTIYQLSTNSRFVPLIGNPGDGDSPHCAIIDEFHEHTSPGLYHAMKTGLGARSQPIIPIITTAGTNISGPCYDKHLEAVRVLNGTEENEELFTVIWVLDEKDDWKDFSVWPKVNPNFGVSVDEIYLRGQHRIALQNPGDQNAIRTKNLGQWMNAGKAWMNMALWDKCRNDDLKIEQFLGRPCWLAFDLANKIDIASLVIFFELIGRPGFAWFTRNYLCRATVDLSHNSHYRKWENAGRLIVTDGARTDFKRIETDIKEIAAIHPVQELGFDPKEASYLIQNIQMWAGFPCTEINQSPTLISEPMKEMEAIVQAGDLQHDGDPGTTWMMGNVVKKEGRSGTVKYYYPTKERDHLKIDAPVAGIMALRCAMIHVSNTITYSGANARA
jgi:phage terminase large subunit-like protein